MKAIEKDNYEFYAERGKEDEFLKEIAEMEANSVWITDVDSKRIRVYGIDASPLFTYEPEPNSPVISISKVEDMGHDRELIEDTVANTGIMIWSSISCNGLLRDTAMSGLLDTAKLSGSALGALLKKDDNCLDFAKVMNLVMPVARSNTLVLIRCGKISALHSGADGGYEVMPISDLLEIVKEVINNRFGGAEFVEGYNSHGFTRAYWTLPTVKQQLMKTYEKIIHNSNGKICPNLVPAIRFMSSDTANSSAILDPVFLDTNTNVAVKYVDGAKVRHTRKGTGGADPMEMFREQANNIFAKFNETTEVIAKLSQIEIQNPANAVVSLCKKYYIGKKYGDAARAEAEMFCGGGSLTAHDVYLCLHEALAEAERCNASQQMISQISEAIARVLHADWHEHDVGGTVAW